MDHRKFEDYIARALQSIPPEFAQHLDNVEVMWEDEPSPALLRKMKAPSLFGLYEGVPLTERTQNYTMMLPDRITIYRKPIESVAGSEREIIEQIRRTVIHEVGHHFGLSEEEIRQVMGD